LTTRIERSRTLFIAEQSLETSESNALPWISDQVQGGFPPVLATVSRPSLPHPGSTICSRSSPWENASKACLRTPLRHSFKMPITTTKLSRNASKAECRGDESRVRSAFGSKPIAPHRDDLHRQPRSEKLAARGRAVKRPENKPRGGLPRAVRPAFAGQSDAGTI